MNIGKHSSARRREYLFAPFGIGMRHSHAMAMAAAFSIWAKLSLPFFLLLLCLLWVVAATFFNTEYKSYYKSSFYLCYDCLFCIFFLPEFVHVREMFASCLSGDGRVSFRSTIRKIDWVNVVWADGLRMCAVSIHIRRNMMTRITSTSSRVLKEQKHSPTHHFTISIWIMKKFNSLNCGSRIIARHVKNTLDLIRFIFTGWSGRSFPLAFRLYFMNGKKTSLCSWMKSTQKCHA